MAEFQHVNKGALENLFESDLTRNLFQFQNTMKHHHGLTPIIQNI